MFYLLNNNKKKSRARGDVRLYFYQENALRSRQNWETNVASVIWFNFSSHCQSEAILWALPAAAYIMSAEDCHSLLGVGGLVKVSAETAEGGQFALLHKPCFPSSRLGWCSWWWSRNRSDQRKDGMLHTLCLPKEEESADTGLVMHSEGSALVVSLWGEFHASKVGLLAHILL